jgi:dipeptidyl aminopeptidase/acylaminoacyl peptidase
MVMTPERYKRIKSVFQSAVDLPHSEQAIFLDKACSDDEGLRREVEDLLSSHGQVKDSIEVIASEVAATMLAEPLVATPPNNDEFINPRFSPDGRRIAFQRFDVSVRVWDIWIMNADGGAQSRLTFAGGGSPSWSPDGKRIAFYSQRRTGNSEIYVMDVSPTAGLQ